MKKILTLLKTENAFHIKDGETELITIDCKKKTIQGKDIFEKIYKTLDRKNEVEVIIVGDSATIIDEEAKTVLKRLQELFHDIDQSINQTLSAPKVD